MFDIRQSKEQIVEGADKIYALYLKTCAENERLRAALGEIIGLDHHNHGPESRATKIARDARNHETEVK